MNANRVILIGRLGKDTEIKTSSNGMSIGSFTLATSRKLKDGEKETQWHNIKVFGGSAEFANQYLHKGDLAYCEGSIKYSRYQDAQGIEKLYVEIICNNIQKLNYSEKPHSEQVPQGKPEYASKRPEDFKMQHANNMKANHQPNIGNPQPTIIPQPVSNDAPWDDDIPF